MYRAFFIALGIFAIILGIECMLIDQVEWRPKQKPVSTSAFAAPVAPRGELTVPPDWAPWSFVAGGAVTILYAFALPKRFAQGQGA